MGINKSRLAVAAAGVGAVLFLGATASGATAVSTATPVVPANSVNSASIIDGNVWQKDMAPAFVKALYGVYDNTVTSPSVKNGSLALEDFSAAAKAGLKGDTGATGATGAKGDKGDTGEAGAKGDTGAQGLPGKDANGLTGLEADGPYPGFTDLSKVGDPGTQGSNSTDAVPGDSGAEIHTVWTKCADGKVAIGGGFHLASDASLADRKAVQVLASEPTGDQIKDDPAGSILPTGWKVEVLNNGTSSVAVQPWAVCVKIG